jgi:hypothetical protein
LSRLLPPHSTVQVEAVSKTCSKQKKKENDGNDDDDDAKKDDEELAVSLTRLPLQLSAIQ